MLGIGAGAEAMTVEVCLEGCPCHGYAPFNLQFMLVVSFRFLYAVVVWTGSLSTTESAVARNIVHGFPQQMIEAEA